MVVTAGADGTGTAPEATPGTDVLDAAAVAVPEPAVVPSPEPAVETGPAPAVGGIPARPGRGAGARAVDILSSLSGLRRRTRNPRR